MFGISIFVLSLYIHHPFALIAHGFKQPDHVVTMLFDGIGEIKATASALRARNQKQIRKALTVQSKERFCAFLLPLIAQRAAFPANDHIEGRGCHPLKACRVNQDI